MILGIDEAGRGSVVGPLVVGALLIPQDRLDELPAIGVRDSKQLSPRRREELYDRLGGVGRRLSITLDAPQIDEWVARGRLNRLEALAFGRLIAEARPRVAFVDACDTDADRFGREVAAAAPPATVIVARHHADAEIPVVGGASIVAKVLRDRAIARLAAVSGIELGSGYPSDLRTRAAVRRALAHPPVPTWIRRSWKTAETLKPRKRVEPIEAWGR
jgi:ribonuclease HII